LQGTNPTNLKSPTKFGLDLAHPLQGTNLTDSKMPQGTNSTDLKKTKFGLNLAHPFPLQGTNSTDSKMPQDSIGLTKLGLDVAPPLQGTNPTDSMLTTQTWTPPMLISVPIVAAKKSHTCYPLFHCWTHLRRRMPIALVIFHLCIRIPEQWCRTSNVLVALADTVRRMSLQSAIHCPWLVSIPDQ
jgi:hypothetical protein